VRCCLVAGAECLRSRRWSGGLGDRDRWNGLPGISDACQAGQWRDCPLSDARKVLAETAQMAAAAGASTRTDTLRAARLTAGCMTARASGLQAVPVGLAAVADRVAAADQAVRAVPAGLSAPSPWPTSRRVCVLALRWTQKTE
jgi:hypothetical protein